MRTHYDTLGISENATKQEIKEVYRRLCMETHPDVNKSSSSSAFNFGKSSSKSSSTEKFKEISHAYSVLSHETRRKEYDIILKQQSFMHIRHNASRAPTHHPSMTPFTRAVYQLPRNLVIGCGIGIFAATFANYFLFRDNQKQEEKLVEAWKNPKTGQWEQPAPWDEYYRKLQPEVCNVPRHYVQRRNR